MRISRFCEARGWYEADNSIESKIFCFGDEGGDDGGGDDSPGSTLGGSAGDFEGTNFGGDTAVAGGNLYGGGDDDRDRSAVVSPNTGQVNTQNFNIDRSQPSVTTADGSRVYGDTITLSQGLEEGAFGEGATFTEVSAPSTPTVPSTPSGPSAAEIAAQKAAEEEAKRERALEIASTPTFDSPFDYESDAYEVVGDGIAAPGPTALSPEQDARLTGMLAAEGVPLPGATTPAQAEGRQAARDAFAAGTGEGLIEDLDVFDVDALGPVDLDEVPAGALPAGTPAGSPAQQITAQATAPATSFPAASNLSLADSSTMAAMEDEVAQGLGSLAAVPGTPDITIQIPGAPVGLSGMPGYTGPSASQQRIENVAALNNLSAQADLERPFSPIPNMEIGGVTIPSIIGAGINAAGELVNTLDMYGGGNLPAYMEDVIDRPAGTPVFSQGPMMSYAPDTLELTPLEQAMVAGSTENVPLGPYSPAEGTQEVVGAVGPNNLGFLPGESDLIYVGDKDRFDQDFGDDNNLGIDYVDGGTDDDTTTTTAGDDNVDDNGGDQDDKKPPVQCPEGFIYDQKANACVPVGPVEYVGQDIVGGGQYTPRGPINIAYTGLPSLAPAKLKPTFQAKGQYSALFPTG